MHQKFVLPNGLTVVHRKLEGYQSLAIGVWVKVGSVYETPETNGMSHFIEHMIFKGTKRRSAKDISLQIDQIGGEINAYTAKECTCYYTKTLGSDIDIALDLLSDIVFHPLLLDGHIDIEKIVIEDEINMYEDAAEELVSDLLQGVTFGKHPLALSILGTKETLNTFNSENLRAFYQMFYVPSNMVLSIAGQYDETTLYDQILKHFGAIESGRLLPPQIIQKPNFHQGFVFKKKENEQVQVSIDFPGIPFEHERSYDMTLLSNVFGGTNSSILFQSIREERGLSYSVFSEPCFYDQVGTLNVSFSVSKEHLEETLGLVFEGIKTLETSGLSEETIEHAKAQLRGSVMLGLEGSDHVMDWIGRVEMFSHKEKDLDAIINKINRIEASGVKSLYKTIFSKGIFSMAIVGDLSSNEVKKLYSKFSNAFRRHHEN